MTRWNLILKLIFPPPITTTNPPLWPTTHGDVVPNPHFLFWTRIYYATLSSEKWRKGCGKQCTSRHLHAPGHFIGGPNNLNSKNTLVGLFPLLENWALLIAWAQPLLIRMGNLISLLGLIFYWVPLLMRPSISLSVHINFGQWAFIVSSSSWFLLQLDSAHVWKADK